MGGAESDAEDVVQEAFIRFWRSRDQVADATAYLYACVKHCALDWQRGRNRRSRREEAAARREGEPMFAGRMEQDERRAAIETALETLPQDQRRAGHENLGRLVVSADRRGFADLGEHGGVPLPLCPGEIARTDGGGVDHMNETPDPFEVELSALRPREVSPRFRQGVSERLAGSAPSRPERRGPRQAIIAVAMAAACLVGIVAWQGRDRHVDPQPLVVRSEPTRPSDIEMAAVQDAGATLLTYQRLGTLARRAGDIAQSTSRGGAAGPFGIRDNPRVHPFRYGITRLIRRRLMRRWNLTALFLSLTLFVTGHAAAHGADGKPDPTANAAMKYWQAFALLPALDKDQEALLEEWHQAPLDGAALKLIEKSEQSRQYLFSAQNWSAAIGA